MNLRSKHCSHKFGLALRAEFPIFEFKRQQSGRDLVFLDSAASSQKPKCVVQRVSDYLNFEHANVHRGAYELSAKATDAYEAIRLVVAKFIGAPDSRNIIFTKGATESINIAAYSLWNFLQAGDVILVTMLEHHSNIVPWQILAERKKARVVFADITESGQIDIEDFRSKVQSLRPKIVAFSLLANALGTLTPHQEMIEICQKAQALVLLDASQFAAHASINVESLHCDFLAFSSHKLYGPTGAGVLYASDRALDLMEPVYGGGDMISIVSTEGSQWAEPPQKFEAGTPAIAEILGMGVAIEFLQALQDQGLSTFEESLFEAFFESLSRESGVTLYGPRSLAADGEQTSILSFNVKGVHPHDFATVADQLGVQVRAGHHCAQPLMKRLGIASSVRASLAAYSDLDHKEPLLEAIRYAQKVFGAQ